MGSYEALGLSVLNSHATRLRGPSLLHELVQSRYTETNPALEYFSGLEDRICFSYRQLHELSDSLAATISRWARSLPEASYRDQFVVPLMIPQSPQLYIAQLAILKAGGAFCPLNLDAPVERTRFILNDVEARLVLASSSHKARIPEDSRITTICVDDFTHFSSATSDGKGYDAARVPTEQDLAYVMYTSGSTGTPKGVAISHLAATQSLLAHNKHLPSFSRFLQFAAPTFDVSVFEIYFPLFRGSTLVCCDRASMLTDLPGVLRKLNIDACELTPSVAGSLLKSRANAPCLRLLLTIGEMLTQPVVDEFAGGPEQESLLWGMYGPTEAAIHCTLQPAFSNGTTPKCIGFPLDTVSAFVIGIPEDGKAQTFELLPIGQAGELAVGGLQLASGYINRPEQTKAAFVHTDFGIVYKTGDKAVMRPDGTIECLGRVAEGQVKLNGQRLELGEIEHAILRTDGCHSAFVCVLSNLLVAFAAVDDEAGMEERIINTCHDWLPAFMIPADIVILKSFPRLPSGKVDRQRLKQDYVASQGPTVDGSTSQDALLLLLCGIAGEVLGSTVSPDARLASVGMDSLSSIDFAARMREQGYPVTTLAVLNAKTFRGLCHHIQGQAFASGSTSGMCNKTGLLESDDLFQALAADPAYKEKLGDIKRVSKCTSLQVSMLSETLRDPRLYVNTTEVAFPQGTDATSVKNWLFEVAAQNEIIRSGFVHSESNLVQVVWDSLLPTQIVVVEEFSETPIELVSFLERPLQVQITRETPRHGPHMKMRLHHALYDGWSFDLLLDDLDLLSQQERLLPRPQFRHIAPQIDADGLHQADAAAYEFWADYLRGAANSQVPNFRSVAVPSPDILFTSREVLLDPQTARHTASLLGVSSQAIFQACISWMWSAITGSEDITLGSVFSGRTAAIPGIERMLGPCIQTLPLRVKIGESLTIDDLIRHLHSTTRQILQLPALSLSKIKKSVDMPPGSRLFDLLFVYQESLSTRKRRPKSVKELWHMDHSETKLVLEVAPGYDRFICQWTWHTDCFAAPQVEALAESFSHLVHYFIANPGRQLNSILPSFPVGLRSVYGRELCPVACDTTVVKLVEEAVERSPETRALCFADSITTSELVSRDLSYAELNGTANRIARHLLTQGVVPGGLVAIAMEKSPMLYCGILGILKAGCAYLPILPSTPVKRIQMICDQAQPQLCMVDSMPRWRDSDLPSRTAWLAVDFSALEQYDSSNLEVAQDDSQLAYVIYTSGTTGTPKGVAVTNKNLVSNIMVLSRIYPHDHGSRMLQACSQAFDVSVFEIFFTWANGMCLCAATNDTLFASLELSIRQMKVTHLSMTVTVASLINPENVPSVKFLVTSGEPMTDEVLEKWADVLYQGYGPSETTNICTVRKVSKGDSAQYLGWSFENTLSVVLNPQSDDAVPIGYIGELCFGGDQVAAGYLNMPELTASKFFEHPRYGRLYRSGDLGRMLPDGSLIISGRIDTQIKLRGQRIELQEIHSVIFKSAFAKACATLLVERQGGRSQQLVTFYVPSEEGPGRFSVLQFTTSLRQSNVAISQMLRATLPAYMIPTFLVPISSVPLTSSGKIDTRELHQTVHSMPEARLSEYSSEVQTAEDSTDWNATERLIAQVLTEVLAIDPTLVNRWVPLNSLGLDSISAITFSRKLQAALHRRVPISLILQSGSVARLAQSLPAAELEAKEGNQSQWLPSNVVTNVTERFISQAKPQAIESILPCTPLQEAMLASSSSTSDSMSYCNQVLFRLHQDPQQMIGYWEEMHRRHGILRTCFMSTEIAAFPLVQTVMASFAPAWKYWRSADMDHCVLEQMKSIRDAIDTFSPPISLAIISTPQHENYLSFVCHHAMYDGMAIDVLLSEIESLAGGLPLPPAVSFEPFLREALSLPPDTDEFWAEKFLSFTPQRLPPDLRSFKTVVRRADASGPLTRDLDIPFDTIEKRIRELGGSLLSLCQSAWAMSLSVVLDVPDVCFGNVVSGRSINKDGIERLVAPCFNTIPLRTDLSALASNGAVVHHFLKLNADILPYQFTPLRRIHMNTGLNDAALFETVLLLQPTPRQLDSSIWELERESGSMGVPLICEVVPSNNNNHNKLTTIFHRDSTRLSDQVAVLLQDLFVHFINVCLRLPSSQLNLSSKLPVEFEGTKSSTQLTSSSLKPDSESSPIPDETWSETERKIRAVVAKLSQVPETRIGRQTSFYRLGLDSIAIVQLAYLLRQNDVDASAVTVLSKPTCAAVASQCASQQIARRAPIYGYDLTAFTQRTRDSVRQANLPFKANKILPCTPLQQGMISQFLLSRGLSYFNYVSWLLNQDVDIARLKSAWELAVRRHEILRTGFLSVTHPDTPFAMIVYEYCDVSPPVECISGEHWHNVDVEKWRDDCSKRAFHDLCQPPWNVALVQQPNGKEMHLAMHHALYDASSLKELLEDVNFLMKDTEPRATSPIDGTVLSLLSQAHAERKEAEDFWSRKASELVVNTFPTMTPLRIESQGALTTSRECSLRNSVLRQWAARGEITIQAALQAALTRLLASYLGENAVTFGIVLNSRSGEAHERAMFPQLATLPVIANNSDSNRQILDSMMEYNASLRRFINTPLSQVQKWLRHSGAPLFDTILVYQPWEQQPTSSQPWRVIDEKATIDYPLSLEAEESASGSVRFNLVFQPNVLPTEQAVLFLSQFDALFTQLLECPDGNAQQVAEKHQSLFSILPAEYAELPSKVHLLHHFVELNAIDSPQKPALEFVGDLDHENRRLHWNYRELNECGNQVANLLVSHGVEPGRIVAVCFDKCPEAYFAILGILKAGCAFVALDTSAPPSRQEFILGDSGAVALLVKKENQSSAVGFRSPAPLLEIDLEGLASLSSSPPKLARPIVPSDTCYCLYTSGTTGTPKGCLITHDNTVQAMLAFQDLFSGHWDGSSRWLQFASLHFDVSVLEQYWSWSVGITVVSAPRDLILSDLVRTISELGITHIDLTPSLARLVHPDEVPSLCKGVFITGGEQLRQDILDVWGSKSVIYNAYGPTEATIGVTMYQQVPQNGRASNIGRQFLNVGSFVLQPGTDIPVLKGGVGELCVSGKLVGKGYLNRAGLTEERFPTLKRYDTRVYRTGDLVRVLHDGCFDFLGRADDQVKLRGQRLEIGEINHTIRAGVSEILDAATLVTKHRSQDRDMLVTFIVTTSSDNKGQELEILSDPSCLRICGAAQDACRAKLPGYMVPTYVLAVPFIPLSANNKAQTNMLKGIFNDTTLEQLRHMGTTFGNEDVSLGLKEPRLAKILEEVAGLDEGQILTSSTVYELGFDSISVIELARRLQEAGFSGATPSVILQHPRLADLRKHLREASDTTITSQVVSISQAISAFHHKNLGPACEALGLSRADISYVAPCTALQEGMLSRSAVVEGQETYFNTFRLDLKPNTSKERLKSAWKTVLDGNAILRTCFLQTPDGHAQVSLKSSSISWSDHRPNEDIEEYLTKRYKTWVQANQTDVVRPYEIDSIECDSNHILIVRMFHGIYDARSLEIILQNVKAAYEQAEQLTGPPFFDVLPHGPLCDFDASRPFWLERFDGFIPRPISRLTYNVQEADVTQSRELDVQGIESRRMILAVTQQAVVQAAWLFVLKQNYPNWPAVGVIFSGRSLMLEGVNNTVGPLFNTLPFRVRDSSAKDWPNLILETHHFNTSALPFVHTPLRQIQKWCSRGKPLFDSLFSFGHENTSLPVDNDIWVETGGVSKADYPLACEVIRTANGKLRVTLVAQGHVSDMKGLNELLDGLEEALASIVSDDAFPGQTLSGVDPSDARLNEIQDYPENAGVPTKPHSEFIWNEEAHMLQREIASLAEIDSEQVMEDTSLLELGLDSIDAVKLVARLRRLGMSVTTGQLMKQPTIRAILENHQNARPNGHQKFTPRYELESFVEKLRRALEDKGHALQDAEAVLPPTPLQESMVAEMIQSDFQRYFNHDVLELRPGTDLGRLQEAIRTVISQSPILRSCFVEINNPDIDFAYCQVVNRKVDAFQPLLFLDSLDSFGSILEQARARAAITEGRSNLLQVSPVTIQDRHFIVLSISHALYDGTSLDLFHQDVLAAYQGRYRKRNAYNDVLGRILNSSHDTAKKFWSGFLHGANATLVAEREEALIETNAMLYRAEIRSATEPSCVKSFCKKRAITTQTLGQSCWAAVLSTLAKSLDVTFGVVLSGRDTDEAQDLMFPTMNTVPVRVVLHGTVEEYIQYVWGNLSRINEFQHFPLRAAQKLAGRGPLFNTLFTMQTRTHTKQQDPNPIWESIQSASQVEYPICVEMELMEDRLLWRLACGLRYLTRDEADNILRQIDQAMSYLVGGDGRNIISLDPGGRVSVCSLPGFQVSDTISREAPQPGLELGQNKSDSERREVEARVIDILAEISKVDRSTITADQSIYHLGLDSISAIKASSVLRKKGLPISARDMVKAASIREFVHITSRKSGPKISASSSLPTRQLKALSELDFSALLSNAELSPDAVEKTLPALPVQVHFLTQWQNSGGQLFFNDFYYEAPGSISKETVENAWHVLVRETPVLRTQFVATGSFDVPFVQVILSAQQEPPDTGNNRGDSSAIWCFDGRAGPFAHLSALQRDPASVELRFRIHHALYDGVSLPLLVERFQKYCHEHIPQTDRCTPLWGDFALQHYALEVQEQRKAFWVQYLRGATTAATRPSMPNSSSRTAEFQPAAIHQASALKGWASRNGVSLQALFFAAHGRVLAKRRGLEATTGDADVVFGVYLANRAFHDGRLERALFPTVSIVPLRIQFKASESMAAVAMRVQTDIKAISSSENATVGLWEIEQWTGVRLDSFVNFLHLPSRDEAVGPGDETDGMPLREKNGNAAAYSHEPTALNGLAQPTEDWLARNPVRKTYVDAVDVEAAIRGESLDIGVFSSATLLSKSEAASWVDELAGHLRSV